MHSVYLSLLWKYKKDFLRFNIYSLIHGHIGPVLGPESVSELGHEFQNPGRVLSEHHHHAFSLSHAIKEVEKKIPKFKIFLKLLYGHIY